MSGRLPKLPMWMNLVVALEPRRQLGQHGLGVVPFVNCETRAHERFKAYKSNGR